MYMDDFDGRLPRTGQETMNTNEMFIERIKELQKRKKKQQMKCINKIQTMNTCLLLPKPKII